MVKYRAGRINEEVKKVVSSIIQNDIKDPKLSSNIIISVTRVEVTKDLGYATVFVSILGNDEEKKQCIRVLKRSAGFIRHGVGKAVKLRVTPEILIELDNSIEHGMHINDILQKIKKTGENND